MDCKKCGEKLIPGFISEWLECPCEKEGEKKKLTLGDFAKAVAPDMYEQFKETNPGWGAGYPRQSVDDEFDGDIDEDAYDDIEDRTGGYKIMKYVGPIPAVQELYKDAYRDIVFQALEKEEE